MSIQNTTRKTSVMQGNGTSVKFPFAFRINAEEDLKVYVKIGLGAYELQELNTNYKLSDLVRDSNGNIISGNIEYPIAEGATPLTEDDYIYGIRETPRDQLESSQEKSFKSNDMERALDKATMQIQELSEDMSRSIRVEEWQTIDPDEILDAIFDAEGNAGTYATNAANSASAASTSESNASTYASNSQKWAEGTDEQVSALGGTHSAKEWANQAASSASSAESAVSTKANITLDNVSTTSGFRRLIEIQKGNNGSYYKVFAEYNPITGLFVGNWCEQGGYEANAEVAYLQTITLLKPFSNTNYNVILTGTDDNHSDDNGSWNCTVRTTTTFTIFNSSDHINNIFWYACGYL